MEVLTLADLSPFNAFSPSYHEKRYEELKSWSVLGFEPFNFQGAKESARVLCTRCWQRFDVNRPISGLIELLATGLISAVLVGGVALSVLLRHGLVPLSYLALFVVAPLVGYWHLLVALGAIEPLWLSAALKASSLALFGCITWICIEKYNKQSSTTTS